jgi:2',3'-cyclic-nucleotide 2'-phosphodiesterase (5'-nucleotidase family)
VPERPIVILHTNDLHGKLTDRDADVIADLRCGADAYFDSGDAVKSGNLGIPLSPEPVWQRLARAGCNASVPGNREFHVSEAGFRSKIAGAAHPILASNLVWNGRARQSLQGDQESPLPSTLVLGTLGVFGVTVQMVTDRMRARAISAFLNTDPFASAAQCVETLSRRSSAIVCLSHLGLAKDIALAERIAGIDLMFGGHSHDILREPLVVNSTVILQAGSHARFVGKLTWDGGVRDYELLSLK